MNCPENLLYTKDHEWIKVEENHVIIGITDYAQNQLGDVVYVELPDPDRELSKGDSFGVVESVKTVSDIYSPLSGKVVEVNENLENQPELVNTNPYKDGWIVKLLMKDSSELDNLLSCSAYADFVKEVKE